MYIVSISPLQSYNICSNTFDCDVDFICIDKNCIKIYEENVRENIKEENIKKENVRENIKEKSNYIGILFVVLVIVLLVFRLSFFERNVIDYDLQI